MVYANKANNRTIQCIELIFFYHVHIKLRSHIATLLQNRSNFAVKITTNKIARCEHHGKICSKKYSRAKSLQNRSNFAAK